MLDFLEPVVEVFSFIFSILDTIIQGITGIITILGALVNLVLNIAKLLPSPLYPCFITFVNLYLIISVYQIFRKG